MTIGICHSCKGKVSDKAETCPHCGTKTPYRSFPSSSTGIFDNWIFWVLVIFGISFWLLSDEPPDLEPNSSYSDEDICKAGIATVFHTPIGSIEATPTQDNNVFLKYFKDGTNWEYKCKLEGNQIVWGTPTGRWRNEENITYTVNPTTHYLSVAETFSDGSRTTKAFSPQQLGNTIPTTSNVADNQEVKGAAGTKSSDLERACESLINSKEFVETCYINPDASKVEVRISSSSPLRIETLCSQLSRKLKEEASFKTQWELEIDVYAFQGAPTASCRL